MKKGLALFSLLAVSVLGAGDAHALRAYTPEAKDACASCGSCAKASDAARVGAFQLENISSDHAAGRGCSLGASACQHGASNCPLLALTAPVANVAGLVVNPVAAVLNDAATLLALPYRPSEPLN